MFVYNIKPGSSEEEEEEDVMDILQVCLKKGELKWSLHNKNIYFL